MTFFGEDLNGRPLSRIPFPNATAANVSFLAALSGSSTDTLEELIPGTLTPLALTFSGISSTILNGGNSVVSSSTSGTDGFGEFPTSGNIYIAADPNSPLSITFSSPITAFGFFGTDIGDSASAHLNIVFSGTNPSVIQTVNNTLTSGRGSQADGSVLFFGYINTAAPFTNVLITSPGNTTASESFGFDDPVIGVAGTTTLVPEPASLLLLISGFTALSAKLLKDRQLRN